MDSKELIPGRLKSLQIRALMARKEALYYILMGLKKVSDQQNKIKNDWFLVEQRVRVRILSKQRLIIRNHFIKTTSTVDGFRDIQEPL
jgi:hypothetical protein